MYDCLFQHVLSTYHFSGKERDSESGLDNFGARYNSSQMGRFMSADPLVSAGGDLGDPSNPQSWNAYSYVRNNPLSNVDPDGLDCVYINDNSVSVKTGDCYSDTDNGIFVNGTINTNSFTYNGQTQTLGFNYTNDDTGALGSGVIAGVAPSSPPTSTDYLNAVAHGTQMSRPIVEPTFWATMGFLGTFGPGILESSLALPGAGLTIPGGGLAIGKMGDLGNLGPGERTLMDPGADA
jgi:RHS repeat-associated protein